MKSLLLTLALVGLLASELTACSTFSTAVAPKVADGVNRYCREPLAERQLIRSQVNGMITPNTIKVTCQGDPE